MKTENKKHNPKQIPGTEAWFKDAREKSLDKTKKELLQDAIKKYKSACWPLTTLIKEAKEKLRRCEK